MFDYTFLSFPPKTISNLCVKQQSEPKMTTDAILHKNHLHSIFYVFMTNVDQSKSMVMATLRSGPSLCIESFVWCVSDVFPNSFHDFRGLSTIP